jgi:phosphate transport system protein
VETDLDDAAIDSLFSEVSRVLLTVRDLERVGDHAVNIAARTLYMTESDAELIY